MRLPATGDASAISPPRRFEAALVGLTEDCNLLSTQVKGAILGVVGLVPGMTGQLWYSVELSNRPIAGLADITTDGTEWLVRVKSGHRIGPLV
jgi:hypothetical protein